MAGAKGRWDGDRHEGRGAGGAAGREGAGRDGDIVSLGLVSDVFISGGKVMFSITVPAERARELEPLRQAAEKAVRDIPGVDGAMVVLTAEKKGGAAGAAGRAPPPSAPARSAAAAPRAAQPRGAAADKRRRPRRRRDHRGGDAARAASASRRPRSISRSASQANGLRSASSTPTSTARRCRACSASRAGRKPIGGRHPPADGALRRQGHVDGLPRRGGDADDLARADGASRR